MRRQAPDASISLTILLLYVGVIVIAALVVLLIRWWLRIRGSRGLRIRSNSEEFAIHLNDQRDRLRRKPKRKQNRRRP